MTLAATHEAERGLDGREAAARSAAGRANVTTEVTSRSVGVIIRANVVTRFNALLGGLLVVILIVGPPQDALFGLVLVGNTLVGVLQEIRAKRTLDRLQLVGGVTSSVVRDGVVQPVAARDVVEGDVIEVRRGDQIVVDGAVLVSDGLEVDESMLTGESDAVHKPAGTTVRSGTWVVAGVGRHRADVVGDEAYAHALANEGRRFALTRSELRVGIDRILRGVTWVLVPTGVLLVISQLLQSDSLHEAARTSVAGVVNMVPEGLVLLTSTALAVGVTRLGRRQVLVQELSALEGLARVDVLCVDKTGTLTEATLELFAVEPLDRSVDAEDVLARLAATDPDPNPTLQAIARARSAPALPVTWQLPFSSAARWSAFGDAEGAWALGAPDVLFEWVRPEDTEVIEPVRVHVDEHVREGRRVLLLGRYPGRSPDDRPHGVLHPVAVVTLDEKVRPEAAGIVTWFREQGVSLRVLSGDAPRTVGAVAGRVGIPGAEQPFDARHLPSSAEELAAVVDAHHVFGRVGPRQKLDIISALQRAGHTVGMVGDGVNDVLALKQSDLGVAMGNGASAARNVAQVVLVDPRFDALPPVVAEGRRVIGNVERVGKLFVTKTVYACLLALAVGVAQLPFPFYPRHLTLVSSLTIGIPGFFLALAPNDARVEHGFAGRVLRAAVPAGVVAAAATFSGYALARDDALTSIDQARTSAMLVLFGVAMWVLVIIARPYTRPRLMLLGSMVGAFAVAIALHRSRGYFALTLPRPLVTIACIGIVAMAGAVMEIGWRLAAWRVSARGDHGS